MTRRALPPANKDQAARLKKGLVTIIDDDTEILVALAALLDLEGYAYETFTSPLDFLNSLNAPPPKFPGPVCVLSDVKMPELDGLELQRQLVAVNDTPLLLMSGMSGVEEAVTGFRAGALDFILKPIDDEALLQRIDEALAVSGQHQVTRGRVLALEQKLSLLTNREREVAQMVVRGQLNREIAAELNIALRTVKVHRQRAMEKLEASNTAELVRLMNEEGL
ncbi:MAG: response regulator [Acidobacteria bacterium]|nr:response regulator [Acidobacteriota bacterium]